MHFKIRAGLALSLATVIIPAYLQFGVGLSVQAQDASRSIATIAHAEGRES